MTDAADFRRLCALAGLQDSYQDGKGHTQHPPAASRTAFLEAMGLDSAEALESAPWRRVLPPVMVHRMARGSTSTACRISITLPSARIDGALSWILQAESGARHRGSLQPGRLPLDERRLVDGTTYERRGFDRLQPLPAGYHVFRLPDLDASMSLIVAPARCFHPGALAGQGRLWGLSVQVYSLRSARNWGIGDFTDLRNLGTLAAGLGAGFIGLNPLHARTLADPEACSPYAPSSRLFVDPLTLDPEAIEDYAESPEIQATVRDPGFQGRLAGLRATSHVDYRGVSEAKTAVLGALHRHFRDHHLARDTPRAEAYRGFLAAGGEELHCFADFEAARAGPETSAELHGYLQWQADLQLRAVAASIEGAGMALGLTRDLAVGPATDGAEAWSWRGVIAQAISAGAPPDDFNPQGQVWNLPVFDPLRLRDAAYRPFIELLRANMRHAGALRIDHVMALARLFWIPEGAAGSAGGYVSYPFDDLMGILALESLRHRCLVVGEDLGSVPGGLRERLADAGVLGTRVLLFEREGDGRYRPPESYPRQAIVTPTTHDLPTLAGFWLGRDLQWRARLGTLDAGERHAAEAQRGRARAELLNFLAARGMPLAAVAAARDDQVPAGLIAAIHRALADAPAMLIAYQLDDILGEEEAVNLPGTSTEYPNWRRKLGTPLERLVSDPRLGSLAAWLRSSAPSDNI